MYLIEYMLGKYDGTLFINGNCLLCRKMHRTLILLQHTSAQWTFLITV